ncbi:hypothetical protein Hanom_Chr14g01292351 [Helianthus anomalus]
MNTARVMNSAPLKKRTLLRLRCQPAIPIGTKRTTQAAISPNWTAPKNMFCWGNRGFGNKGLDWKEDW